MRGHQAWAVRAAVAVLIGGAALTGCGSDDSSDTAATAPSSAAPSSAAPSSAAAKTVTATETEFSITLSEQTFAPGSYTFQAKNTGQFPHDLHLKGPDGTEVKTEVMQPGTSGEVTADLKAGTYEVWCAVGMHRSKGMDLKINVA